MKKNIFFLHVLLGCFLFLFINIAEANPPSRVARLSYFNGQVSFWPASLKKWVLPTANRPLIAGDRLWSDSNGKVELQLGRATLRIGARTSLSVFKLDDHIAQFRLDQGTLNLKILDIKSHQAYEIDTPNIAFYVRKPGDYRIDVDQFSTIVSVRSGKAKVYGAWAVYATVKAPQSCRFTGTNLRSYRCFPLGLPDSFDRWCSERDRRPRVNISIRYVSPEVIGYEDLDTYGTWRFIEGYGNVWMPNRVAPGWAPYRFGHWAWIDPWGWTWIDNEPWGFAPFHYGRWVNVRGIWYWVPGRVKAKPVYSPALVAFVGNSHLRSQGGVSLVAWFPLGPKEIYRPAYKVSRDYFVEINSSNTTLNDTYISKQYNQYNNITNNNVITTNVVYVNQSVPNAISAVPAPVFTQAKPVSQAVVPVAQQSLAKEAVKTAPPVVPTQESIAGNKVVVPPVVTPPPVPVAEQKPAVNPIAQPPAQPVVKEESLGKQPVSDHAQNLNQVPPDRKQAEKESEKPLVTSPESHADEKQEPHGAAKHEPHAVEKPESQAGEKKVEVPAKPMIDGKPIESKEHVEKIPEKAVENPVVENKPPVEVPPIEKPVEKLVPENKPIPDKPLIEKPLEAGKAPEKPIEREKEKASEKEKPAEQPVQALPSPPPPMEEKVQPMEKSEKQQEEKSGNHPPAAESETQKPKELKEPKEEKKEDKKEESIKAEKSAG